MPFNSKKKSSRKTKTLSPIPSPSTSKPLLDLLEIQRKSFFDLLEHGIVHELTKIDIFRETATLHKITRELELSLNPETYKFISPTCTPKQAILKGKTYACKLYVQATLVIRAGVHKKAEPTFEPRSRHIPRARYLRYTGKPSKMVQINNQRWFPSPSLNLQSKEGLWFKREMKGITAPRIKESRFPLHFPALQQIFSAQHCFKSLTRRVWLAKQYKPYPSGYRALTDTLPLLSPSVGQVVNQRWHGEGTLPWLGESASPLVYKASGRMIRRKDFAGVAKEMQQAIKRYSRSKKNLNLFHSTTLTFHNTLKHRSTQKVYTKWIKRKFTGMLCQNTVKTIPYVFPFCSLSFPLFQRKTRLYPYSQAILLPSVPLGLHTLWVRKPKKEHAISTFSRDGKKLELQSTRESLQNFTDAGSVLNKPFLSADLQNNEGGKKSHRIPSSTSVGITTSAFVPVGNPSTTSSGTRMVVEGLPTGTNAGKGGKVRLEAKDNDVQIFQPWIFIGELPLMTKRGHFILNGSPRVVVNQIARCPGIYFQEKRRGVGFEQEIRVSADLIPQRGPWLRIQSDWEGRFWARLKQEGRVKYAILYEAFLQFEKQYNAPLTSLLTTSSSPFLKSEIAAFQDRKAKEDRQKNALIRLFKNSIRYSLGKLGRFRLNQRVHCNSLNKSIRLRNLLQFTKSATLDGKAYLCPTLTSSFASPSKVLSKGTYVAKSKKAQMLVEEQPKTYNIDNTLEAKSPKLVKAYGLSSSIIENGAAETNIVMIKQQRRKGSGYHKHNSPNSSLEKTYPLMAASLKTLGFQLFQQPSLKIKKQDLWTKRITSSMGNAVLTNETVNQESSKELLDGKKLNSVITTFGLPKGTKRYHQKWSLDFTHKKQSFDLQGKDLASKIYFTNNSLISTSQHTRGSKTAGKGIDPSMLFYTKKGIVPAKSFNQPAKEYVFAPCFQNTLLRTNKSGIRKEIEQRLSFPLLSFPYSKLRKVCFYAPSSTIFGGEALQTLEYIGKSTNKVIKVGNQKDLKQVSKKGSNIFLIRKKSFEPTKASFTSQSKAEVVKVLPKGTNNGTGGKVKLHSASIFKKTKLTKTYPTDMNPLLMPELRDWRQITESRPVNERQTDFLLMSEDIGAIHSYLEHLLEGQGFTDDIDHLKNRFVRTSGKLLQQQFELGLQRLNEVITPLIGNLLQGHLAFLNDSSEKRKSSAYPAGKKAIPPFPASTTITSIVNEVDNAGNGDTGQLIEVANGGNSEVIKSRKQFTRGVKNTQKTKPLKQSLTKVGEREKKGVGQEIGVEKVFLNSQFPKTTAFSQSIPLAASHIKRSSRPSFPLPAFTTLHTPGWPKGTTDGNGEVVTPKMLKAGAIKVKESSKSLGKQAQINSRSALEPLQSQFSFVSHRVSKPFLPSSTIFLPFGCFAQERRGHIASQALHTEDKVSQHAFTSESYPGTYQASSYQHSQLLPASTSIPSISNFVGTAGNAGTVQEVRDNWLHQDDLNVGKTIPDPTKVGNKLGLGTDALPTWTDFDKMKASQRKGKRSTTSVQALLSFKKGKHTTGIVAPFRWLRTSKPVNGAFREFFGSNPLSQYMDQTNPLAEITHKRRLSSMGPGGIKRETAGMEVRGIHPTHYGRVCPIETPEGKNAGLVNSPTVYSRVDNYGFLETPLYQVVENQVQMKKWTFLSAQQEENEKSSLATCDTGLTPFNLLPHLPIPVQTANNPLAHFQQVERSRVGYKSLSPVQTISIATALIPFLEHDDANRALMGSNMQRQAIPLLLPERPIVGTGFEPLAIVESGQALQSTQLGCVSYVNAGNIIVHSIYSRKKALGFFNQCIKERKSNSQYGSIFTTCIVPLVPSLAPLPISTTIPSISNFYHHSQLCWLAKLRWYGTAGTGGSKGKVGKAIDEAGNDGSKWYASQFPKPKMALLSSISLIHTLHTYAFLRAGKPENSEKAGNFSSIGQGGTLGNWFAKLGKQCKAIDTLASKPQKVSSCIPLCTPFAQRRSIKSRALLGQCPKPHLVTLLEKPVLGIAIPTSTLPPFVPSGNPLATSTSSLYPVGLQNWHTLSSSAPPHQTKGSKQKEKEMVNICSSHNVLLLKPVQQALQLYQRSNQETCLTQRPLVQEGHWVERGDFLADCSASHSGDLALGKNVTVAYMPWEGYNFEDAIVISDRLISDDVYTSLHIERYEIKVNKNSQGKERITNRIPGTFRSLQHLDNSGIASVSSWVQPGDILVGKVVELKRPLSPYERLAWELASRLSPASPEREKWLNKVWLEDISLRLPPGVCGRVINSQIVSSEWSEKEQIMYPLEVHVYLAVKRKIQVGDKLAGRHGNKGIVSTILPRQDMPYLGDGNSIDMVLNPLGVPSRMNVGQIFECLLGLAGSQLGCNFKITPFDEIAGGEASRSLVFLKLYQCRLMHKQQWLFTPSFPGKSKLFDGRTGEPFENWVTVGQAYMLKLIHMVDHKIHARSIGPYSLFTRQPVRGRSRRGGQRLGEMEVWAVEGFGAAYTLQEFLTIKSDDLKARTALQRGFYKQNDVTFGKIHISPGNPEAFKVLVSELQALCLHIQME